MLSAVPDGNQVLEVMAFSQEHAGTLDMTFRPYKCSYEARPGVAT